MKKHKFSYEPINIKPKNERQATVIDSRKNLVMTGCAGTGKTFLACWKAFKAVHSGKYHQAVLFRSAVSTRDIGHLPGTEREKMSVYSAPFRNIANKIYDRGDAWELLERKRAVRFEGTSFVRGCEFDNSYIVVDECQNMSYHELDSLITRVGINSKIMFCGDIAQADLRSNGFKDFYTVLQNMSEFEFIEFGLDDIVRSGLVESYLRTKYTLSNKK